MGRRLIVIVIVAIIGVGTARAADLDIVQGHQHRIMTFQGPIGLPDVERMAIALAAESEIREIWFDSMGGNLEAGIRIGEAIRLYRIATRIRPNSSCASACAFAFMGGIIRSIDPGGRIGIHMASGANSAEYIQAVRNVLQDSRIADIEDRVRAVIRINEQYSAKAARRQARYLAEMGVSLRLLDPAFDTPHSDIHWLNAAENSDYNVVN
jgi:hypothetical protein